MERFFFNIKRKDKIKNEYIYKKKTQIKNIKNIISKLKWNWAGHTIRRWPIERKRKKGKKEDNSKDGTTSSRNYRVMSCPESSKEDQNGRNREGPSPKRARYNLNL